MAVDGALGSLEPVTRIRPSRGWSSLKLGEVWAYRELLYFLVWRDVKVRYKQTALGVAWVALQPLATKRKGMFSCVARSIVRERHTPVA